MRDATANMGFLNKAFYYDCVVLRPIVKGSRNLFARGIYSETGIVRASQG